MVPTLWACYAIFGYSGLIRYCHLALCGHRGLSDGVHLKNDIDKIVTVYAIYGQNVNGKSITVYALYGQNVNGKSITVHALYGTRHDCMRILWA